MKYTVRSEIYRVFINVDNKIDGVIKSVFNVPPNNNNIFNLRQARFIRRYFNNRYKENALIYEC